MSKNFANFNQGISLVPIVGDPASPANGDMWYNSTLGQFRKYENGVVTSLSETPQSVHSSVVYVSPTGSDLAGTGSYGNPFQSIGKANTFAATLSPSLSNIITIVIDTGFYAEAPGFTFVDFCNYVMAGGADTGGVYINGYYFTITAGNATAGATYTDGTNTFTVFRTISGATAIETTGPSAPVASSGTLTLVTGSGDPTLTYSSYLNQLPITVTPGLGSQIQIVNINVGGIDIQGDGNGPFFYNDTNTSNFQVIAFYGGGITGEAVINSNAGTTTQLYFYNLTFHYDPSNIGMTINGATVQLFTGSLLFSPVVMNTLPSNAAILNSYGSTLDGNITVNANSITGPYAGIINVFQTQANSITVTLNGDKASLHGDSSIPDPSNVVFTGGALTSDYFSETLTDTIANASNVPGKTATDALNNVLPLIGGTQASAIVSLAKLQTSQSGTTTTAAGSNAGSGASSSLQGGSTDLAGNVSVTAGIGAAAGQLVTVTYANPFPNASWVTITSTDSNGAVLQSWVTSSNTGFQIQVVGTPTPSTTYSFNYHVIGF